jgi:predicted nucleic acid-binding protein
MDVMIAAVALASGQSLVTDNVSHFANLPIDIDTY